jgi:hypothetical protein
MEIGTYTFPELSPDPATDEVIGAGERLRNLLKAVRPAALPAAGAA